MTEYTAELSRGTLDCAVFYVNSNTV